jgi:hypothetical protein
MLRIASAALLLRLLLQSNADAFAPTGWPVVLATRRANSHLYARYTPPLPPVPPTPPLLLPVEPSGPEQVFQEYIKQLNIFTVELPSLDSLMALKEQAHKLFETSVLLQWESAAKNLELSHWQDLYFPTMQPIMAKLTAITAPVVQSTSLSFLLTAFCSYFVASTVLNWNMPPPPSQPYPVNRYDPVSARAYFDKRTYLVIFRTVEVLVQSLQFGLTLLKDKVEYVNVECRIHCRVEFS